MVTQISHIAHLSCPSALRGLPAWLIWKFEPNENPGGKPRKVPYYAAGTRRLGVQGRAEDRHQLVTFDAARAAAARRGYDGVGFAPMPEFGVVAFDFDACVRNGKVTPEVAELLSTTYAEFSPSGTGVRAFFMGQLGNLKSHPNSERAFGVELFSSKGYVTFTGNVLPACEAVGNEDTIAPVDERVLSFVQRRFAKDLERASEPANYDDAPLGLTKRQIAQALEVLPNDLDYDTWVNVGMALHHEYRGDEEGFEVWDTWSRSSPKYTTSDYGRARWNSFGQGQHSKIVTARSLVHLANEHGAHIDLNAPASAEDFDEVVLEKAKDLKPPRFPLIPAADFIARPAPTWIIKDVLPKAELVVVYGESGSGKTFSVLDMVIAIATGQPWREKRVKQGRVVYIAAEGSGGFRNRLAAAARRLPEGASLFGLEVIAGAPNFMLKDDALDVARSIGRADVVVVDTFAQVMPGGNENAGEDVGKVLAHCKGIHRATGALVLLVHHAGKDPTKGARGWSGLRAAADAEIEVVRSGAARALRLSKQKDGEDGLQFGFALERVELGLDSDGDPITSCVVIEASAPVVGRVVKPLGPVEQVVNEVIQEMAQAQTTGIEVEEVIKAAVVKLEAPQDRKRDTRAQRCRRALKALTEGDDAPYFLEDGCLSVV